MTGARTAQSLPLIPVPAGFLVQPIDPAEVPIRLVELALGEPVGRVPDMVARRYRAPRTASADTSG